MEWKTVQSRLRSKAAWIALFSLIALVLKNYCDVEVKGWDELVNTILLVLTGFGIFNDPTNKEGF